MRRIGSAYSRTRTQWIALLAFVFLGAGLGFGCEAPEEEEVGQEQKKKVPADRAKRVEIKHQHAGDQAHKRVSYELAFVDGEYEFDGYPLDRAEAVSALQKSVENLTPSDSLKTCRFAPTKPTFRITLPMGDERVELISTSQCKDWAPWNVIKGGKLYVQLDGSVGKALLPILQEINPEKWKELDNKAGVIDLVVDVGPCCFESFHVLADGRVEIGQFPGGVVAFGYGAGE